MAKKTTADDMDSLHAQLANTLKDSIEELKGADEKRGLAALLNVARQFLKDNNVTALPVSDSPLKKLTESLPFAGGDFPSEDDDSPLH